MNLTRVWRAYPGFEGFHAKVWAARRSFVTTGELTTIKLSRLLASDPETCAKIERDAPHHPHWRPELTFESLADLFEFVPEAVVADISPRAVLFVAPEDDALIAGAELPSAHAKANEPKRLVMLPGLKHHEIYGSGAGFAPTMEAAGRFLAEHL
jgi:fermentation-respiration switch protein FrsA (DUF1100 family)